MSLFLAIFAAATAAQAAPAPTPAQPRPVACLYDRLDHAYLADLWTRLGGSGMANDDPILARLNAAGLACQQLHGWPDKMVGLAGFYAMARAHGDAMLEEKLPAEADRALLVRAVQRFAPAHLDILGRDGEGGFGSAAKVEFRAYLASTDPDLLRRFDYEELWSAAMPSLVAEITHAQFAFVRDLG